MKVLIIKFDDPVNISVLPKGTVVTVSSGPISLLNGSVRVLCDVQDPEPHEVYEVYGPSAK